jgi:uncharacterized protein YidB (DUF937 family)
MFTLSRPDVTDEGWHTWPTEKASHALARNPQIRSAIEAQVVEQLEGTSRDVAAFRLAPLVREVIDAAVRDGEAPELNDGLISYGLSRVDWLQLADALVEAALPEAVLI